MKQKNNYIRSLLVIIIIGFSFYLIYHFISYVNQTSPEEILTQYLSYIPKKNYHQMYMMLSTQSTSQITQQDFIKRHTAIYEGIDLQDMFLNILEYDKKKHKVTYEISYDTIAGPIYFINEAFFKKEKGEYKLLWNDGLIVPELTSNDKVRISTIQAKRGNILDRNGYTLAGEGIASSVGIVPGKLKNREDSLNQIAQLLDIDLETIEKKLSAKWIKEDSFVPIKTIPKVTELQFIEDTLDQDLLIEKERQEKLLEISGVMLSDIKIRYYPLGKSASHLIGYIQNVTAEDLEEHKEEGYTATSVMGKTGLENLFESSLKGQDGYRIYIENASGEEIKELVYKAPQHGQDIQLTIDVNLQLKLYEQFKNDKSCSVAINPKTGEVLALVSTPSYNNNDFVMGLSLSQWQALNNNQDKPMYNRYRQVWCPGSTFKPITAAIGLETKTLNPQEVYKSEGLSWQQDTSWGSYYVTTLHTYSPIILENALMYSDNIYFAKVALQIGTKLFQDALIQLGFNQTLPFEIKVSTSQYANTNTIETNIQLADSGYGQGELLINPIHMATIYSAFCNQGNMIKPYLLYQKEITPEYWMPQAFSNNTVNEVLKGMKKVINDPNGTGYLAYQEDIILAGKTGTAEIKASKEDTNGNELGWFAVFTTEDKIEQPILLISLVEDVKGRGGSNYVLQKDNIVLNEWLTQ